MIIIIIITWDNILQCSAASQAHFLILAPGSAKIQASSI